MSAPNHGELAQALIRASRDAAPIAPLTETHPDLTPEDGYRIQQIQVDQAVAEGRRVAGYKVGLTAASVQRQMGVDQPDFGRLFADTFSLSGQQLDTGSFIAPRIEPEIAFVLAKPLGGEHVTVADVIGAVDYAIAALEIVDSRIVDWRITLPDTIADHASGGGVVLGSVPVDIRDKDLRLTGAIVRRNGTVAATGAGAAVLGSPLASVAWLASKLGSLGTTLEAGSVVLSGAFTPMISAAPGDVITADFAGFGSVTTSFSADS